MGFFTEYGNARETERTLDDQALARQRQVVTDTGAAQARMERMKQAEIRRRMPETEPLPDTTQIQYAAPAVAGGQGGAGQPTAPTGLGRVTGPVSKPGIYDNPSLLANQTEAETQRLARMRAPGNFNRMPGATPVPLPNTPALVKQRADAIRKLNPADEGVGVTPLYGGSNTDAQAIARLKAQDAAIRGGGAGAPNQYDKPTPYDPIITQAATQNGIDPVMFKRLIGSESSFNPTAASPRGESFGYGIAQIAAVHGLSKAQMADPAVAVPFAAKLLAGYIQQAGGDVREGVMRYKGAVSEAGRADMGRVYDTKIAGGAPQAAAPGVPQAAAPQAPATPIARVIASGGFTPEQLSNMAMQQSRMAQFKMQQIQQLAQVTSDPAQLGKMQDEYITLQDAVREAHFANLYSQGKLSDAQYAQISAQERARAHAAAAERYKAVTKAEGEIAVEDAKGANARVLEQQKAIAAVVAAGGKPENAKVEFSPDGRTTFVTYGRQVFQVRPGVTTKFGPGESELVPIAMAQ